GLLLAQRWGQLQATGAATDTRITATLVMLGLITATAALPTPRITGTAGASRVTASLGETGRESRPGLIRAEGAAGITPPRPLFSLCVRRVRLSPDGRHSLRGERMSYTKFGRGLALASAMAVGVAFAAPSAQ